MGERINSKIWLLPVSILLVMAMFPALAHSGSANGSANSMVLFGGANATSSISPLANQTQMPGIAEAEANATGEIVRDILGGPYNSIVALMSVHGYTALFVLMLLEGAAFPIPSEVVIPLAGLFSARGIMNPEIAFFAILAGSSFGLAIDYAIGYYFGREFFYKHLNLIRLKRKDMENFEGWFQRNGIFAIFISRLLPVVRSVMSFPAGFVKMPLAKFFLYSIAGLVVWDAVLMAFGYYAIATNNAVIIVSSFAAIDIALYYISRRFLPHTKKGEGKASRGFLILP